MKTPVSNSILVSLLIGACFLVMRWRPCRRDRELGTRGRDMMVQEQVRLTLETRFVSLEVLDRWCLLYFLEVALGFLDDGVDPRQLYLRLRLDFNLPLACL